MNKTQLNRLLKKKGWTGKEVGQLLFLSLYNDIQQKKNNSKKVLFSQSDFDRIESSLDNEQDFLVYGVYRDLYSSVIDSINRGQGLYQQFFHGFFRLYVELLEMSHSESAQKNIDRYPLIVTESQYNRLEAEARQTLSEFKESLCSLVFHCLDNFLEAEEEQIKEKAPAVWEALEASKEMPATGNRFLPIYNAEYGQGYYSLPDGRRSDQMTNEEWRKALYEEYMKMHKLNPDKFTTPEEALAYVGQRRLLEGDELFFKGAAAIRERLEEAGSPTDATDEELENALSRVIRQPWEEAIVSPIERQIAKTLGYASPATWHTYKEPPEGLSLYDLLGLYSEEYRGAYKASEREAFKHFKADAPDLYNALKAYIEDNIPQARGLKATQYYKDIISWGELAALKVENYERLIQPENQMVDIAIGNRDTTEDRSRRGRAGNGIAILKYPSSYEIDANGDFVEPKNPLLSFTSILSLEGEGSEERIEELHSFINWLINPAMSYFYSFNALMGILGAVYDLPELAEVSALDTKDCETKMSAFNGILYTLYEDVYGNDEEKKHKRAILKKAFRPLETDSLKPSQEAINEITQELINLGYTREARRRIRYLDAFLDRLMNSKKGA